MGKQIWSLLLVMALAFAATAQEKRKPSQFTPDDEDDIEIEIDEAVPDVQVKKPSPPQQPTFEDAEGPLPEDLESEPAAQVRPSETARPSAPSGQKIFDWSKHQGESKVPHPFAEKGLIKITKDQVYLYQTEHSPQNRAASVRLGMYEPINLENPERKGERGATFEENYDQTRSPIILVDYEWQLWRTPIGKWGLRAGSGAYVAQGNGHFVSDENQNLIPKEVFTFIALPNSVGAVYRMHRWDRQLLVPYAEGGGIAFTFAELRDDDKGPKFGGALAAYYAFGLAINLTYFDALSRVQLDREYGINAVYLTAEYRGILGLSEKYDFTADMANAGLLMEF